MNYERWTELADREAAGEKLPPEEQEFLRRYAEENPECRAELDLWSRFGDFDTATDDVRDRAIVMKALEAVRHAKTDDDSRLAARRRNLAFGLAGLAAAAGVAMAINGPKPATQAPAVASIPILSAGGSLRVDGAVAGAKTVSEGSVVEAEKGACLEVGPAIFACLAERSRLRLTQVSGRTRRVDLLAGSVAVTLPKQPEGARFSVVAAGVWSTVVGTAFSVEVNQDGVVQTEVFEGKVRVGGENTGEIVSAHKLGLSRGHSVRIEDLVASPEGTDWDALERVSGKQFELPEITAQPAVQTPETAPRAAVGETGVVAGEQGDKRPEALRDDEAGAKSAGELLQRARQFRRERQWASAATAYRELQLRFPTSAEAHAALVSLGELELQYLGNPRGALARFDAYLENGGPLAVEAELGRIRAQRALGNAQEELRAIRNFLSHHPESVETESLRERVRALTGTED